LYFVAVVALAAAARTCDFVKERGNFPGRRGQGKSRTNLQFAWKPEMP